MIWENKIYVKEQEILLCRFNQSVSVMVYFWPELSYVQQESPLSPVRDLEPRRFLICEAILRKRFSIEQALQIPITFFFSFCIDKAMAIIPTRFGGPWGDSFVYLVIGCIIMSLGISFEVIADVIMLPAEAFVRAFAKKTGFIFGNVKVGFDSTLTILAMILALICFHKLNGVREGTLINALVVGQMVKQWRRYIEKPLSNAIA